MTTVLLVLAVIAGVACPAHMWWRRRRGEQAVCCPPQRPDHEGAEALRERQRALEARITELAGAGRG